MGGREAARRDTGGGERIPALRPAGASRLAIALAALVTAGGLGALAADDAGASAALCWVGTGIALGLLAASMVAGVAAPAQWAVAMLGALLLLRHHDRLALSPLYGAGLLLVLELTQRAGELRGIRGAQPTALGARLVVITLAVGVGACAAGLAALAVTAAPGRSVAMTAVGAAALVSIFAVVVRLLRRH